jgi:hypothetical protein
VLHRGDIRRVSASLTEEASDPPLRRQKFADRCWMSLSWLGSRFR